MPKPVPFLSAAALSLLIVSAVAAQSVPTKPGLWASASEVMINGTKAPTLFDIKGVPEAQKAAMAAAMAQMGLPAGWNPSLSCQTQSTINIQTVIANVKDQGCTATVTETAADHVKYRLACKGNMGVAAGEGSVTGIGTSKATYTMALNGTANGRPMAYRTTSISKFVGPSCANPPAGINPDWIGR
jgi:hypothetical protein